MSANIRNNAEKQCPLILDVRFGSVATQTPNSISSKKDLLTGGSFLHADKKLYVN